jgi:hypothetical protein
MSFDFLDTLHLSAPLARLRIISVDDLITGQTVIDPLYFRSRSVSVPVRIEEATQDQEEHEVLHFSRAIHRYSSISEARALRSACVVVSSTVRVSLV